MSLFKIYKIKKHITSNDYQKWHLSENKDKYPLSVSTKATQNQLLSGVPDYFGRNKISSGGDLSHYSSASLY